MSIHLRILHQRFHNLNELKYHNKYSIEELLSKKFRFSFFIYSQFRQTKSKKYICILKVLAEFKNCVYDLKRNNYYLKGYTTIKERKEND